MGTQPTDEKEDQKFLTLADKKPSLIRDAGNESTSARTMSTRELSENLQRTRDGLMGLMKKKKVDDGLNRAYGIDDGNDEVGNFGVPVRNKKTRLDGSAEQSEETLYDTARGELTGEHSSDRLMGQHGSDRMLGDYDSQEFGNIDPNRYNESHRYGLKDGGSIMETTRSNNATRGQQGKHRYGSKMDSNDDYYKSGKDFYDKNDKLFAGQKPKKDGPLSTRIFIDVFLPTVEGNRIFPLFNYRCAEKIDRSSKDFYERNQKTNKQLTAVSSQDRRHSATERQVGSSEENQRVEDSRKVGDNTDTTYGKDNEKLDKSRNKETFRGVDVTEGMEKLEKVEKIEELQQKDEFGNVIELQHAANQVDEIGAMKAVTDTKTHEEGLQRTEITLGDTIDSGSASENQNKIVEPKDGATSVDDKPSPEDDGVLQKILRALMENEELVDFFCEKVISKLAARNDFCGPNCKGRCGGLNKPTEEADVKAK